MRSTIEHLYGLLVRYATALQSPFLLVVRLYWGWQFAQSGLGHLQNLQAFTTFFSKLGIPAPAIQAPFIGGLELVGGILLALGLGSRLIALLLAGDMLVAFLTADLDKFLSVISDPATFYSATPYTFLFAAVLILLFGPGAISIDALIAKRLKK
jgi:putative oxidoreductase